MDVLPRTDRHAFGSCVTLNPAHAAWLASGQLNQRQHAYVRHLRQALQQKALRNVQGFDLSADVDFGIKHVSNLSSTHTQVGHQSV